MSNDKSWADYYGSMAQNLLVKTAMMAEQRRATNTLVEGNHKKTVIWRNGQHYWVSTNLTWDAGWETMIFPCNAAGEVSDWMERFSDHYDSMAEAHTAHDTVVSTWMP